MTLLQQIKTDQLKCRRAHITYQAETLTTLYSEAAMIGKDDGNRETTDVEVIAIAKKFIKNIDETLKVCPADRTHGLMAERKLIEMYLPQQLSEDELKALISDIVEAKSLNLPKDMGQVMKALSEAFTGQYDGKTASILVRNYKKD